MCMCVFVCLSECVRASMCVRLSVRSGEGGIFDDTLVYVNIVCFDVSCLLNESGRRKSERRISGSKRAHSDIF